LKFVQFYSIYTKNYQLNNKSGNLEINLLNVLIDIGKVYFLFK